jgi:hypothetical protein
LSKLAKFALRVRLLGIASTSSVLVMSWSLDGVLGHFDNLASLSLFSTGFLGQVGVNGSKGVEHRFVQCGVIGMNSGGVLS